MTEPTDPIESPAPPPYEDSGTAPFVYFDVVLAHGVMNGAVQIELASRVLVPGHEAVSIKFVSGGHLRCSPTGAMQLRDSINAALQMLEQPQQSPAGASRLN